MQYLKICNILKRPTKYPRFRISINVPIQSFLSVTPSKYLSILWSLPLLFFLPPFDLYIHLSCPSVLDASSRRISSRPSVCPSVCQSFRYGSSDIKQMTHPVARLGLFTRPSVYLLMGSITPWWCKTQGEIMCPHFTLFSSILFLSSILFTSISCVKGFLRCLDLISCSYYETFPFVHP